MSRLRGRHTARVVAPAVTNPLARSARAPRTIWHWLVAVVLGTLLALGLSLGLWAIAGRGDAKHDPRAVWLFGFQTTRVDPRGTEKPRRVDVRAFGSVAARGATVYMYDPGSGRVGRLDARTNTMRERRPLPAWDAGVADETIAATSADLWLVTGSRQITRLDPKSLAVEGTTRLDRATSETWIAANGTSLFTLARRGATFELLRLDASGDIVARNVLSVVPVLGAPTAIEASGTRVWAIAERGAYALRPHDLVATAEVLAPRSAGTVRNAAAIGNNLWIIGENGTAAYRLRADADPARVALVSPPRVAYEGQTDLAVGQRALWVLAPTGSTPDARSAVVHQINPTRASITSSLDVPSSVFVGAIAVTE
jgi:hypothetical protein